MKSVNADHSLAAVEAKSGYQQNSFGYRWRVRDQFSTTAERMERDLALAGGKSKSLINDKLLSNYKVGGPLHEKPSGFTELMQDAIAFLQDRHQTSSKAMQDEIAYNASMSVILDRAYSVLITCAMELNATLGFSELYISSTAPSMVQYPRSGKGSQAVGVLRAHLSTSFYSLVVLGDKNKIGFFLVPVEDTIGMGIAGLSRAPVCQLAAHVGEEQEVIWQVQGENGLHAVTDELLETICVDLLKELINATKSVIVRPI